MSVVDDPLEEVRIGDGGDTAKPKHLRLVVRRVRAAVIRLDSRISERIDLGEDRIHTLELAAMVTHDDLDNIRARFLLVDELPDNAPLGAIIRLRTGTVAQRLPLYLGNGDNQPLTKLTPTPL